MSREILEMKTNLKKLVLFQALNQTGAISMGLNLSPTAKLHPKAVSFS